MSATIARSPLGEQVYLQVLQRIQQGTVPAGAKLRDAAIAPELGVSRTPVREALLRLAREGCSPRSRAGASGSPPRSRRAARRSAPSSLRSSPSRSTSPPTPKPSVWTGLADIVRRLEQTRGDIARCIELDEEFHRVLLEDCPNRRLLDPRGTLRRSLRRYLHHYLEQGGRVSLSSLQHSRIAEALRKGDRAAARQLLERKWRRGMDEIESALP